MMRHLTDLAPQRRKRLLRNRALTHHFQFFQQSKMTTFVQQQHLHIMITVPQRLRNQAIAPRNIGTGIDS
jgi:hypothetical protein